MWENFVIAERIKMIKYQNIDASLYFWRTTQQQEIDLIEDRGGELMAYEFKWNEFVKSRFSKTFTEEYSPQMTQVISPGNIEEFL